MNPRHAAFCREYVIDFAPKQAAIRAGYSEKSAAVTANRLLAREDVQKEIARLTAQKVERADADADEVIQHLTSIMRADIGQVMSWGHTLQKAEGGLEVAVPHVKVIDSEELPDHLRAAVSEVSMSPNGTFKVKMHDRLAAIEKLMKHFGLYEADNAQKADPLAELIDAVQGSAIPIATRKRKAEKRRARSGGAASAT